MNTYLDTKVLDKMLFKIPKEEHEPDRVKEIPAGDRKSVV